MTTATAEMNLDPALDRLTSTIRHARAGGLAIFGLGESTHNTWLEPFMPASTAPSALAFSDTIENANLIDTTDTHRLSVIADCASIYIQERAARSTIPNPFKPLGSDGMIAVFPEYTSGDDVDAKSVILAGFMPDSSELVSLRLRKDETSDPENILDYGQNVPELQVVTSALRVLADRAHHQAAKLRNQEMNKLIKTVHLNEQKNNPRKYVGRHRRPSRFFNLKIFNNLR